MSSRDVGFDWSNWLAPQAPAAAVHELAASGAEIVLYGAGTAAADVMRVLQARGVRIRGVLDAKSARMDLLGVPVSRPDAACWSTNDRRVLPVVIGIFNAFVDVPALTEQLRTLGWSTIVDFVELHALLPEALGDRYWLTKRDHPLRHSEKIATTDRLWADEASRLAYRGLLRFRATGDRLGLFRPDCARQYFAADVPAWSAPLRFVDCGACDGDTIRQMKTLGVDIEAVAAFEPDARNFATLAGELETLAHSGVTTLAWPCGVAGATRQLRFRGDHGAGSALAADGEQVVQCVSIDESLAGFSPNLIKMDIEGAEADALSGARRTIERHRPGLAVCVYHRPSDLWELPALVASWNLGYNLYLRCHQHNDFDVVLYAVPTSTT